MAANVCPGGFSENKWRWVPLTNTPVLSTWIVSVPGVGCTFQQDVLFLSSRNLLCGTESLEMYVLGAFLNLARLNAGRREPSLR